VAEFNPPSFTGRSLYAAANGWDGGWVMGKLGRSFACALVALVSLTCAQGCSSQGEPATGAAGSGDGAFRRLAGEVLEFYYKQDPSTATYLGITSTTT
jgi:hypothetical protein